MYKKTFTNALLWLVFLFPSSLVVNAQTYGPCDAVDEYVYAYATSDNSQIREETFSLPIARTVTIQYGFDSDEGAKGFGQVCLYFAGGGTTPFGCVAGREDETGSTVIYLNAGDYRMTASATSVNPSGEGGDRISSWIRVLSDKITPVPFNVTGGGIGCDGGNSSFPIGLDGSEGGVTYQLYRDNVPVATFTVPLSGGGPFSFGNFQTPGTYTVATVSPCISVMMNGSAVITDPRPASFTVSNNGPKCAANPAPVVTLTATNIPGATYIWEGPYGFSQTTATNSTSINGLVGTFTYSVRASINGCTTSVASTSVTVYPAPPQAFVGQNQNICAFSTSLSANPPGSGFLGQWSQDGGPGSTNFVNTGDPNTGVNVTVPGTYTYKWTISGASVCQSTFAQMTVTYNVEPGLRTVSVTNNGQRCSNEPALTVTLNSSQQGVNYQLKINGVNSGSVVGGTGGPLTWTDQGSGTYTVQATGIGGCTRTMDGSPSITVNPAPALRAVSGGATVCSGTPVSVVLTNSEPSVMYQLLKDGVSTGVEGRQTGTGANLTWPVQASGNYTIVATRSTCTQTMANNAIITINPVPQVFTVSGGGTQCFGGSGFAINLGDSETGVSYQLKIDGVNAGQPVAGTGAAITWQNQTTSGAYTVVATHGNGGCTQLMADNGSITINPLPTLYDIGGGGPVCSGTQFAITLSGSDQGVEYVLKRGTAVIGTLQGTGNSLGWSGQQLPGDYTITATNPATTCTRSMGTASVSLISRPSLYSVSGGGERCENGGGVAVGLNGSQATQGSTFVKYQLLRDNFSYGPPVYGTGLSLNWSLTEAGTYTVLATHSNGCTRMMASSATITLKAAPTISAAGIDLNVCGEEITLSANAPIVGTGSWKQVSGPTQSHFVDTGSPVTVVSIDALMSSATYAYEWTITLGDCKSVDTVQVIYNAIASQADAGEDQTVCDTDFAELAANPPSIGNGHWELVSGPGEAVFLPDIDAPDAYLYVFAPGTYVCKWIITNEPCEESSDEVQITFGEGCLSQQAFGKEMDGGSLRKEHATTKIAPEAGNDVQVFPVPASQFLTVQVPFEGTWKAELRNLNGALMQASTGSDRSSALDVSGLPAGVYILYIQSNNKRVIRRVEVMR